MSVTQKQEARYNNLRRDEGGCIIPEDVDFDQVEKDSPGKSFGDKYRLAIVLTLGRAFGYEQDEQGLMRRSQ